VPIILALAGSPIGSASATGQTVIRRILFDYTETQAHRLLRGFPIATTKGSTFYPFSDSGQLTCLSSHVTQTDVLSANKHSLTSRPCTYTLQFVFDNTGDLLSLSFSGVLVKVPLSRGNTLFAAGRLDALQSQDEFAVVPDSGTLRSRDAFCAALS
jgi:hypothetical protein